MGELTVDPEALRAAGQTLGRVGERFASEWTAFSGRAGAMTGIFGADDVSGLIAMTYEAAYGIADKSYVSAAEALVGYGDGLREMADSYERAEGENAALFARLSR